MFEKGGQHPILRVCRPAEQPAAASARAGVARVGHGAVSVMASNSGSRAAAAFSASVGVVSWCRWSLPLMGLDRKEPWLSNGVPVKYCLRPRCVLAWPGLTEELSETGACALGSLLLIRSFFSHQRRGCKRLCRAQGFIQTHGRVFSGINRVWAMLALLRLSSGTYADFSEAQDFTQRSPSVHYLQIAST